jgi:FtsH-binding integral membrane protein
MGGRRAAYSPDDWVAAALAIYLDVINLFIAILNIIGLTSNN